jgi:UDP-glucose:glycoprotein glucosyltransferase
METLWEIDSSLYWGFIHSVTTREKDVESHRNTTNLALAHAAVHEISMSIAGKIVKDELMFRLMRLSVEANTYAPALEFYETLSHTRSSQPCGDGPWVEDLSTRAVVCKKDEIGQLLQSSVVSDYTRQSYDRMFEPEGAVASNPPSVHTLALYSCPGTTGFTELHEALLSLANSGAVVYVLRYRVPRSWPRTQTHLQGYGMYLDIKNMEYRNLDDRGATSKPEGNAEEELQQVEADPEETWKFEEGEEVQGFVFSRLAERKPHLNKELHVLRSQLMELSTGLAHGRNSTMLIQGAQVVKK